MRGREATPAFVDRPAARWLAALVIVLCGALLSYVHRDDLRSLAGFDDAADQTTSSHDPAAPCIRQRLAEIDGMIEEGVVTGEQAALFKQRAEAMCRATEGEGDSPALPLPAD